MFLLMGNHPEQESIERRLVRTAADSGVRRIVKLSGFKPETRTSRSIDRWHAGVEQEIKLSGLDYTLLRPSLFMQDFLLYAQQIRAGVLRTSVGEGRVGCVDARDIAAVAAKALTDDTHSRTAFRPTGPQALSFPEIAKAISCAAGHPVRHEQISVDQERVELCRLGLPEFLVQYVQTLFAGFETGLGDEVTNHIEDVTGRRPHSFEDFAADHASSFSRN
jgi:uncharacterized protein YbjT (DUF2867 family)